jgi:hypothetical protein
VSGNAAFSRIWGEIEEFRFPDRQAEPCAYARRFAGWTEQLFGTVMRHPTRAGISVAKVALLDRFFEYRAHMPQPHRNRLGTVGHPCVFQVFEEAFEKIRAAELLLAPDAVLSLGPSPAPPPARAPQPGVYFGDIAADADGPDVGADG